MSEHPTFQIPKDVIEPIISAHVSTAVAAALAGRDALVSKAVERALFYKVDREGNPGRGYGGEVPWIQWKMDDLIRKTTAECLAEELPKHKDQIKAALAKELGLNSSKLSPFAKKLIDGILSVATNDSYLKYSVSVTVEKDRKY